MILRLVLAVILSCHLTTLVRAEDAAEMAREAATALAQATARLDAADGASDRVAALTDVVRAYEDGLAALRESLRHLESLDRMLMANLAAHEAKIGTLLAALNAMERVPAPLTLLHPSGALGTARTSMMLGEVAPAMRAEAEALRADLDELRDLRQLEEAVAASLSDGLIGIQAARAALSDAIADRTSLPAPVADDGAQIAALLGRVDTLLAFADGLGALPPGPRDELMRPFPWPVAGALLRGFNEPDAAGIARPGIILAAQAGAEVTAPTGGTIRYAGPLLDYGNVIILEPRSDLLLVFAGLGKVYSRVGQIVTAQTPLGAMGDQMPNTPEFLRDELADGGASRAETLYVEVREAGRPMDPATWFADE